MVHTFDVARACTMGAPVFRPNNICLCATGLDRAHHAVTFVRSHNNARTTCHSTVWSSSIDENLGTYGFGTSQIFETCVFLV